MYEYICALTGIMLVEILVVCVARSLNLFSADAAHIMQHFGKCFVAFCCYTACLMSVRTCGSTWTRPMTFIACVTAFIHEECVKAPSGTNSRPTWTPSSSHLQPRQHGISPR